MLGNIANNIVGLVMIGITLAMVIAFLVWYYRNRQERLFLQRSMDNNELVGIMPRYWKPLDVGIINNEINPIEKGQIDGKQNHPPQERTSYVKTEDKIISKMNDHYQSEINRIDQFTILNSNKSLEDKFENLEDVIEGNGYKESHDRMKQDWKTKKGIFANRIEEAIENRANAYVILNRFKRENSIPVTREPFKTDKIFKFLKILIPVILFSIEVFLNYEALVAATDRNQATYLSFTVAAINVGLSFLIGYLVLTHYFNPVTTSKKPRILFYGFFFALYSIVLVYLNLMLGVFRSLIKEVDRLIEIGAEDARIQAITDSAFKDSVFPFDDLNNITFDGAFLLFMGLFFAIITMIDGYFFKDPIPGYQNAGDNLDAAKKRVQKLKDHDRILFAKNQRAYEDDLEKWHKYRLESVKVWSKYINVVQMLDQRFKSFKKQLENTLELSLKNYRTANMEYRQTQPPAYFANPHQPMFIEDFNNVYEGIAEYNISDEAKRNLVKDYRDNINSDYEKMVEIYSEFFDNERNELDSYVRKLDEMDVSHRGI